MARCSSRRVRKVNCWPPAVFTSQRSPVLSAPSAADRLAALSEAVDAVAELVEFQLSE